MNKSTKAALLSALVFPGSGHFFLKKKAVGIILAGGSLFGVYYIISKILGMTAKLTEKIQSGQVQPDIAALRELIMTELAGDSSRFLSSVTMVIMIFWFVGVVDSYRVGLALDKLEQG